MSAAVDRANVLVDAGRPADALVVLADHLAVSPDDRSAIASLARAQISMGDDLAAVDTLHRLLALAPGNAWAWSTLSVAHQDLGAFDAAVDAAEHAVAIAPDDGDVQLQLAIAGAAAREADRAGRGRARIRRPSGPPAPRPPGPRRLRRRSPAPPDERGDAVLRAARRAVALLPDDVVALRTHGAVAAQYGDLDAAELSLRRALAIDPDDAATRDYLGQVLRIRGDHGGALAAFGAALRQDPTWRDGPSEMVRVLGQAAVAPTVFGVVAAGFGAAALTAVDGPWVILAVALGVLLVIWNASVVAATVRAEPRRFVRSLGVARRRSAAPVVWWCAARVAPIPVIVAAFVPVPSGSVLDIAVIVALLVLAGWSVARGRTR